MLCAAAMDRRAMGKTAFFSYYFERFIHLLGDLPAGTNKLHDSLLIFGLGFDLPSLSAVC